MTADAPPSSPPAPTAARSPLRGVAGVLAAGGALAALVLAALLSAGRGGGDDGSPPRGSEGDPRRGQRLAAQYHCGSCHVIPGVASAGGELAVTLAAFGGRSYIAGRVPQRGDALERWIVDPASLVPSTTMPAMGVTPADARDIAAYLRTLH